MKHIRIISPSGAIAPEYIDRARHLLQSWGFRVSVGEYAYGQSGRFSGTAEERLADINAAFADPTVDIILCSRGGYGLQQIVDRILLPARPKTEWPLVVGFSDITILHALMSLHGVTSLHASMCKALATLDEHEPALLSLRQALEQGPTFANQLLPEQFRGRRIIGGNLSVLYGLQGTDYSLDAIITACNQPPVLLIEDIGEQHYHIDRMLHNLRLSGVLSRIGGVIIGQFTNCDSDPRMPLSLQSTIRSAFQEYGYPIMENAPFGHMDANRPIFLS